MLHSKVYNTLITPDIKQAIISRDEAFFTAEMQRLIDVLASRQAKDFHIMDFDHDASRLMVCMAMQDVLLRGGETLQLLCDYINF